MKKIILLVLLLLAPSMTEASASTPATESVSVDFWGWLSSLFLDSGEQAHVVKSDGTIYD